MSFGVYDHVNHGVKNSYGVTCTFLKEQITINYIFDIAYQAYNQKDYIVHINRKRFFVNSEEPKEILDVLALRCAALMYPLQLHISKFGFNYKLFNFKEIQERFNKQLPNIQREFTGEVTDAYFAEIKKSVSNESIFLQRLKSDFLYALFFYGLPVAYQHKPIQDNYQVNIPIHPYQPENFFVGEQTLKKAENIHDVTFKGSDEKGNTLLLHHQVEKQTLMPLRIEMYYNKELDSAINCSIVQLKERKEDNISFNYKNGKAIEGKQKKQKKENWFSNLFKI
ncbi:hypothetical protein [Tenacibaculum sp.]|uniref:hypothetical protein n=1 Tax=Tenacibaculum sp. TaxID=1906242 RepID=UPI003AA93321